jgi:hypothetical protein
MKKFQKSAGAKKLDYLMKMCKIKKFTCKASIKKFIPVTANDEDWEKLSFSGGRTTSDIPAITRTYKRKHEAIVTNFTLQHMKIFSL